MYATLNKDYKPPKSKVGNHKMGHGEFSLYQVSAIRPSANISSIGKFLHLSKEEFEPCMCYVTLTKNRKMPERAVVKANNVFPPAPKKGHGKVLKKRALSAHYDMPKGHF